MAIDNTIKLRNVVGSPLFLPLTYILAGIAFVHMEDDENARLHFNKALELNLEGLYYADYAVTTISLHSAYMDIRAGREKPALDDIRLALKKFQEDFKLIVRGWMPKVIEPILSLAAANGIETQLVKEIAKNRFNKAVLDDGALIPLLTINTLDEFTLTLDAKKARAQDFTQAQRTLIALLLSATDRQLTQGEIQLALWPDSTAGKARSNFDTLLSRLRKVLQRIYPRYPVEQYLQLEKGILRLENCITDDERFFEYTTSALNLARQNNLWLAGNAFYNAFLCWRRPYLQGMDDHESVVQRRDAFNNRFVKAAHSWSGILLKQGQADEALEILNRVLDINPLHDPTVRELYKLNHICANPGQAFLVLQKYCKALIAEGFSELEIAEITTQIQQNLTPEPV